MSRLTHISAVSVLLLIPIARGEASDLTPRRITFHHENVMGTSLELQVLVDRPAAARRAEGVVLAEIDRLAAIFSNHDASSEFRRWQATRGEGVPLSAELFALLEQSEHWRERSAGAFDARVSPILQAWSKATAEGRRPTSDELEAARQVMRDSGWRLDPRSRTAARLGTGAFTLDAIAKGDIAERACAAVMGKVPGVLGLVLNVGGDLHARGDLAGDLGIVPPWDDTESSEPIARIEVRNASVATSGRSQRGYRAGPRWYSHIIDPRTGEPASAVAAATVIAPTGATADALATALNILAPEEGLRLVEETPGAACLIATSGRTLLASSRWAAFTRPLLAAAPVRVAAGPAAHWSDGYELAVDFEISQPPGGGGRYRRPYVAVWVENQDGFPVKNLLLWVSQGGPGPFRWIPDLNRWYKSDQVRKKTDKTDMVLTMSRPTRPPGKYSVTWDGKDTKGNPVAPGTYTLCIDAAREHGTYQGMRQTVKIGGEPATFELPGGVEIKAATVAYRPKTKP